jgi:hypothetical protein
MKLIKKFFKEVVWEYFPAFMMLIIITIMYVLEQQNDVQANVSIQEESCDFPVTPQLELIEY